MATVGRYLVRYVLVVVIAWIGALKYTGYEAAAIQPVIAWSARDRGRQKPIRLVTIRQRLP